MGLTVFNANTLSLLNQISQITAAQSLSMTRLSTGSRINTGADDPAGMIALQGFNAELKATEAAIDNGQRADAMLGVADSAMGEISTLLNEVVSLASASTSSGGLSQAEIAANQAQIDQAIGAIDRIVRTTQFNGKKLLDGSQAIRTAVTAGAGNVSDVHVFSRSSNQDSSTISVEVDTAAAQAQKTGYATTSAASATTILITGELGTATIDIAAGEALSSVAASINAVTTETGVVASAAAANSSLHLISQEYGSDAFLSVQNLSGDSTNFGDQARTEGTDAVATVNGSQVTGDGLAISINTNGISGSFSITSAGNDVGDTATISISGGGATFQLGTESSTRATIGIESPMSYKLGDATLGYLSSLKSGGSNSLTSDANQALTIAREAVDQVAVARGRVGAFQSLQVRTSVNSLSATKTALSSARSQIADVDYAEETAELGRQNILLQSAMALLGVANQQTASILSLL